MIHSLLEDANHGPLPETCDRGFVSMKTCRPAPAFIDLFSGCGGLSLGFLQAGYRCLLAVDNDPKSVHCYNLNLKGNSDAGAVLEDLSSFSTKKDVKGFLERHGVDPSSCDVLIGGPPCQSFSVVGQNKIRALMESGGNLELYWEKKNYERTMLFDAFALFVETLTPRWFLFENVPTIQSHKTFPIIIKRFESLPIKYNIIHNRYLASKYGVPQDRRRFIMVGYRNDLGLNGWSGPIEKPKVTVAQALDDLPEVPHRHREREIRYLSIPTTSYQRFMRSRKPPGLHGLLFDHICRGHNSDDVALFARMKPGARFADPEVQKAIRQINPQHKLIKYSTDKFKDKLHKLDPERPAWTVTAHLKKDCYKFIHHRQPRTITVREAARLQSFPDWFRFDGLSMITSFGLIGNAVPPLLARAFADSFVNTDAALGGTISSRRVA